MCGICGIVRPVGHGIDEHELLRMRDALAHRGPDAATHSIRGDVGLGHRRLKIIDLSEAAAQPMPNEDGSILVVFNGEIYNYQVVRAELEARGHVFRSRSDTEVIVHGYEEWGSRCVEHFNGMFAFAVHDARRREVFLARDHLGIKPLYYAATPHGFLFASEIKAFHGVSGFRSELDESALPEYLLFRSFSGGATLYRNVLALEPGHTLRVKADLSFDVTRYWDVDLSVPTSSNGYAEQQEEVLALLSESVAMQEMSDVPIGAQLSGGTDSSIITALMAARASRPIKTYAVGFEEEGFSELPHARRVANLLGSEHREIVLTTDAFADSLDTLSWQMDEPLTHSNSAGIYWLCQVAKPAVSVLLTGEGADELFAGYHRYHSLGKALLARRWLAPFRSLMRFAPAAARPGGLRNALSGSTAELMLRGSAAGGFAFRRHLTPDAVRSVSIRRQACLPSAARCDWLSQALYYDVKTYLPPVLMRQDRMSMAHGVETRTPFLDHRLVQLAFQLPRTSKLRRGNQKRIVKDLAARYVPRDLIFRPKVGFGFPLEPWMRSDRGLGARLGDITDSQSLSAQLVPRAELCRLVDEHRSGNAVHTNSLWTLLALESWHRTMSGRGVTASPARRPAEALRPG